MRKVVDSNYLGTKELRDYFAASPKHKAVVTDYAEMEMFKAETPAGLLKLTEILAQYPPRRSREDDRRRDQIARVKEGPQEAPHRQKADACVPQLVPPARADQKRRSHIRGRTEKSEGGGDRPSRPYA
jgi:hypothetical protein